MENKMNSIRLRKLLILVYVLYIVLKCHGFVPFKYNRKRKKFEESGLWTIYSAVVGTLFCVLFPLAVKRLYNNINTLPTTRALVSITLAILFLFLVSLVIFYLTIICGRQKIILILNGFIDLYDRVNRDYPEADLVRFQTQLIYTQLKLFGLIMLLIYSLILNLDNYTSSRLPVLILCGVVIPSFALLVLCNLFIQAASILTAFLQRINIKLKKIQVFCDVNAGKRDAVRDCEFSDEIDKMVNYYDRVYSLLKDVTQLCSTQIFLFILNGLGNLITQGFLVFLIGSTFHLRELSSNMRGMGPIFLHFTIYVLYFYFFVQVCTNILLERTMMAQTIHNLHIHRRDQRLKRSIQLFSIQIKHQPLSVLAMEMFEVNHTLLYTLASASVNYLIIVVQFQLTDTVVYDVRNI